MIRSGRLNRYDVLFAQPQLASTSCLEGTCSLVGCFYQLLFNTSAITLFSVLLVMFRTHFYLIAIGAIIALSTSVLADTRNWNPQGDGCVDPKGFLSCYQKNIDAAVGCTKVCNSTATPPSLYSNCIQGCDGFWLASNIGCWIQSCWNEVSDADMILLCNGIANII